MLKITNMKRNLTTLCYLLLPFSAFSQQLIVEESSGVQHVMEIQPTDTFADVMHIVQQHMQSTDDTHTPAHKDHSFLRQNATSLEFTNENGSLLVKTVKPQARLTPRDYYAAVTDSEKKDMRYVLDTLANSSLAYIIYAQSSLKKVVKRIDHIHPLQVLVTICNDRELIAWLHKIRGRDLVWKDLFDTYSSTLDHESDFDNVLPHAEDFGSLIDLDAIYMRPAWQNRDWNGFFDIVFATHPAS